MKILAPVSLMLLLLAAGCITPSAESGDLDAAGLALGSVTLSGRTLDIDTTTGAVSVLALKTGDATFATFPPGTLLVDPEHGYVPALGPIELGSGAELKFLAPYGASTIDILLDTGDTLTLDVSKQAERLVSGKFAVDELARQRDMFPHRTPGMENYAASQAYFAEFFKSLNMEVEVDPFGTMMLDDVKAPAGPQPGPSSMANVVGIKRGTMTPERYLVVGGHYDVVEGTTEGAFDNTGGAVATMAFARAFANVTTQHTLIFGLWGGEEDGILGSQFWVQTNAEKMPFIDGYYNFDVTPLAYPAPANDPAPLIVAAGPDVLNSGTLHEYAALIESTWLQSGAEFVYEGVIEGQATGGGVNAQSDHTPFMARGVPVFFSFTSRVDDVFAIIHSDTDNLENLLKYALNGREGLDSELTAEERIEAELLLAKSFETPMYLAFYWFVLTDAGFLQSLSPTPGLMLPAPFA